MDSTEPSHAATEVPSTLRRRLLEAAGITALALVLNLAGNGRVTLWDRDEPRYAACTREMRERGDWIFPTFNGQPRYDKPVLIYWLMRAGTYLGGDNTFGARLMSGLAGAGTCLIVWSLGRKLLGERVGLVAALVLATAPIMVIESKLSTTDATLTLFLVGCQACLWVLCQRPSRLAAAGFWVLLALATLTKGPIGPALIAVSGVVSWWWGGPTQCWGRLRWRWGVLGFLLITAPWYVAIGIISHGDFYRVALGNHVIRRMAKGIEQHGAFPGYYLLTTLATFYPWSALLPPAVLAAWTRRREQPAYGFLLGWIVGPLILLECVRTKLLHYYLPAYPACAILVAWLFEAVAREEVSVRRWTLGRLGLGLLAGIGIGGTAVLIAAGIALPGPTRWPCLVLGVFIGASTLLSLERFQRGATQKAAVMLVAAWSVILALVGGWFLPAAEPYRYSRVVAQRLNSLAGRYHASPMLATFQEPSVIYTMGHPVPIMRGRDELYGEVARNGTIVSALIPDELATLRADGNLKVEVTESLRVFNLSKGKSDTLHFTLIRFSPTGSVLAGRSQQALVK